jgi:hypothetical protein
MKNSFLSITLLSLFIILASCNSGNNNTSLEGRWEKANVDKDVIVVEFKGNTWQYSKNNRVAAKGLFKVNGDKLTLSEEASGHEHNEAEEAHHHDNDAHAHAEGKDHNHEKAHSHDNGEAHDHDGDAHKHNEAHEHTNDVHHHDMVYKFALNDTELKLIKGKSISIYNKMK